MGPFVPHRCLVLALPYPTSKRSRKNHPPTYRPADHQLATTPSKTPEPYTEFDDTRDESTNSFTEAALSKLLGVSTNSSRRSMDRGATQYSQSDHASAAHYTPEVRSNNYSTSATPTSEYGIYPTSARSGSFPEHIQRQYHPSSNHSGSNGGGMAQPTNPSIAASSPTYPQHKKASGNALITVRKHSKDHELKLFGSCFCPFVQRVWIAMEAKGLQYQCIEVDPYKKPQALLDVNPRGLVPGIRHGDWGCGESTVLMEYLEDFGAGQPLLPPNNPQLRANCRLWADHINRNIIPAFYQLLQAQEFSKQTEYTSKLKDEIAKIVDALDPQGPFFLGSQLSYVDIQFAPWMLRLTKVMKHYRGWPDPVLNSRWGRWLDAVENNEHVKNTTSLDDLYIDSYERYAQNRPNTSELADAVNGGYGLP